MPKRILILDNNEDLLHIVNEILSYEKFEVHNTSTTHDILEIAQGFDPHLIILDYQLSGSNGGDICDQLKHDARLSHIPVMMFSAYVTRDANHPYAHGCDAVIAKPFDLNELVDKVNTLISKNSIYTN